MFYYAIMAVRHTHTNTQIHPLERHIKIFLKNSNQQSYEQTDETGCSGKAVGTVKGRETSG